MRLRVGWTTLQNGHCKSEYSISTSGALREPMMWSCSDGARTLVAADGAGACCPPAAAGADGFVFTYTIAPAIMTPAMMIETEGLNSKFLFSDIFVFYTIYGRISSLITSTSSCISSISSCISSMSLACSLMVIWINIAKYIASSDTMVVSMSNIRSTSTKPVHAAPKLTANKNVCTLIDWGDPIQRVAVRAVFLTRSEEHTSELQSHVNLVCRLLLEKK